MESLIGGPEPMSYRPRHQQRNAPPREMPMPQPPPYVPEPSHQMPEGIHGGGGGGSGAGAGMGIDDDQADIARAVEESMRQAQNQPANDYDEDAELARILEMSKNMK